MKAFYCGDVVPGCNASFRADRDTEILTQVARHARDAHGMETVPPAITDQVLLHLR